LYPKTKGQTEEALAETGFEKVSIFNPAFLETVEPRTRPRMMEHVAFTIFNPINRVLGLGQIINVGTVGKAMHRVAEDASIKPADTKSVKNSVIGSLVYYFPNSNIENIGSQN
jgi:oxidoreductase